MGALTRIWIILANFSQHRGGSPLTPKHSYFTSALHKLVKDHTLVFSSSETFPAFNSPATHTFDMKRHSCLVWCVHECVWSINFQKFVWMWNCEVPLSQNSKFRIDYKYEYKIRITGYQKSRLWIDVFVQCHFIMQIWIQSTKNRVEMSWWIDLFIIQCHNNPLALKHWLSDFQGANLIHPVWWHADYLLNAQ